MTDQELTDVEIRKLEPENLIRAYGLDMKLLHPWHGLDSPFRGAWCVLRPGDISEAHTHEDHEIFIGMSGRGEVVSGERRHEFVAGDIAFLKPDLSHQVVNNHDEDFSYYAIWWDRSMSAEFLDRQDKPAAAHTEAG